MTDLSHPNTNTEGTTTMSSNINITATRDAIIGELTQDNYDTEAINEFFEGVARRGGYRFEPIFDKVDVALTFEVTLTFTDVELDGKDPDDLGNYEWLELIEAQGSHTSLERALVNSIYEGDDQDVTFQHAEVL